MGDLVGATGARVGFLVGCLVGRFMGEALGDELGASHIPQVALQLALNSMWLAHRFFVLVLAAQAHLFFSPRPETKNEPAKSSHSVTVESKGTPSSSSSFLQVPHVTGQLVCTS